MRIVVINKGPLDLVGDTGVDDDGAVILAEADDEELTWRELDAVVAVDEVKDGVRDPD